MDLYISGNSPLVETRQPKCCVRRNQHFSNPCSHVPHGLVSVGSEHQICPLTVLKPIHVLGSRRGIEIRPTEAQNLIVVDGQETRWAMDGCADFDTELGREFATRFKDFSIRDIWSEPAFVEDLMDLFDEDRKPTPLGMLMADGSIWASNVETQHFTELTERETRTPLRHALIRREVNNGKGDTRPCLVLEAQPNIVYRLPTTVDLLKWVGGDTVPFSALKFSSPVAKLLTCRGTKGEDCMALTEDGRVYVWGRVAPCDSECRTLAEEMSFQRTSRVTGEPTVSVKRSNISPLGTQMLLPAAVRNLVAGHTFGAAITEDGCLYVFMTHAGRKFEPRLAELHVSGSADHAVCRPYEPRLAQTNHVLPQPTIVDVAVGMNHIVALTSEGEVYTAGDGMFGQLGIGERQFALHAELNEMNEMEDSWEFAETWQKVEIEHSERVKATARGGKVVQVGAGAFSTLLVLSRTPDGEV